MESNWNGGLLDLKPYWHTVNDLVLLRLAALCATASGSVSATSGTGDGVKPGTSTSTSTSTPASTTSTSTSTRAGRIRRLNLSWLKGAAPVPPPERLQAQTAAVAAHDCAQALCAGGPDHSLSSPAPSSRHQRSSSSGSRVSVALSSGGGQTDVEADAVVSGGSSSHAAAPPNAEAAATSRQVQQASTAPEELEPSASASLVTRVGLSALLLATGQRLSALRLASSSLVGDDTLPLIASSCPNLTSARALILLFTHYDYSSEIRLCCMDTDSARPVFLYARREFGSVR